jgi:hypothetical protein
LGIAPFTACTGTTPRLPVTNQPVADVGTFAYDEKQQELYVDELVKYMGWLCKELSGKLKR